MDTTAVNTIGLSSNRAVQLAEKLNELLANYSVFYQNTRGSHWNIKGDKFFELHDKFEELYSDLLVKIDELGERILTLGHAPYHRFTDYIRISKIGESKQVSDGMESVANIISALNIILPLQREILSLSSETGDEGTTTLMSDYILAQEKLVWMYSAFLDK